MLCKAAARPDSSSIQLFKSPVQGNLNYVILDTIGHNWKCGRFGNGYIFALIQLKHLLIQKKFHPVQCKNGFTRWNESSSAWKRMKTDQVFYSIFEFPGKGDYNQLDWRTVRACRSLTWRSEGNVTLCLVCWITTSVWMAKIVPRVWCCSYFSTALRCRTISS